MTDTRTDAARDDRNSDPIDGVDTQPDSVDDGDGANRAPDNDVVDAGVTEPSNRASASDAAGT